MDLDIRGTDDCFPMTAILEKAFEAHRQGDLAEAERLYRQVLRTRPSTAAALHFLGLVLIQRGEIEAGAKLIRRAIALHPNDAPAHANLGAALILRNDVTNATAALQR